MNTSNAVLARQRSLAAKKPAEGWQNEQEEIRRLNEAVRQKQEQVRLEQVMAWEEQLARQQELHRKREAAIRRLKALLWLVLTAVLYAVAMVGMVVLARLGQASGELTAAVVLGLGLCAAFRCGGYWRDYRG